MMLIPVADSGQWKAAFKYIKMRENALVNVDEFNAGAASKDNTEIDKTRAIYQQIYEQTINW